MAEQETGQEGHLRFWGNSFICDPGGYVLDRLDENREALLLRDIAPDEVELHRRVWPFLRDRRIDAYPDLLKRFAR